MRQTWTLSRQLVDTGVDVDLHAVAADGSLGDADNVIQPAIALVIRLEPADQVLPSWPVVFEDRAPTQLEHDGCAILGRDQAANVRQHPPVGASARVVRPDDRAFDLSGRGSTTLAVADAFLAVVRTHDRVSGCFNAGVFLVAPMEDRQQLETHIGTISGEQLWMKLPAGRDQLTTCRVRIANRVHR